MIGNEQTSKRQDVLYLTVHMTSATGRMNERGKNGRKEMPSCGGGFRLVYLGISLSGQELSPALCGSEGVALRPSHHGTKETTESISKRITQIFPQDTIPVLAHLALTLLFPLLQPSFPNFPYYRNPFWFVRKGR